VDKIQTIQKIIWQP